MAFIIPQITYPASAPATTLTFTYPPVEKPGIPDQEGVSAVSKSLDGNRQTMWWREDEFIHLIMKNVPTADLPAWKAFLNFAHQGGSFLYYPDVTDLTTFDECWLEDSGGSARSNSSSSSSDAWSPTFALRGLAEFELVISKVPGGLTSTTPPTGGIAGGAGGGVTVTPPPPIPYSVSAFSIVSNVVTVTGVFPSTFPATGTVAISGTGTFLDGASLVVASSPAPDTTTFAAPYTHANASSSGLTGTATLQSVVLPTFEDMLDWWMLGYSGNPAGTDRLTQHMSGSGTNAYSWKDADNQSFWLIKSPTGWAMDRNLYDGVNIYNDLTENGDLNNPGATGISFWTNTHAFKQGLAPKRITAPRFFDPNGLPITIVNSGSNLESRTINCGADNQPLIHLGPFTSIWALPQYSYNWGGSVGTQLTIVNRRYFGLQREEFYYCKYFGLVRWTHGNLVSGAKVTGNYVNDIVRTHTSLVAGGCPTPIFPCYAGVLAAGRWVGGVPGAGANIP